MKLTVIGQEIGAADGLRSDRSPQLPRHWAGWRSSAPWPVRRSPTDQGQIDVERPLEGTSTVPPQVRRPTRRRSRPVERRVHGADSAPGRSREYWIAAEERPLEHRPHPPRRDDGDAGQGASTTFNAYAYRAYSANFAAPLGPATVPGPLIEAEVGDTVVVHFRNKLRTPVTMHPHGIFYANEMDGAYKGKCTDPGGFVQHNRTFTYVWEATRRHRGDLALPRPRPDGPAAGLQGPVRSADHPRARRAARPKREFFLGFHSWDPLDHRPEGDLLLHQRQGLRRQHAEPAKRRSASASPSTSTASTTSSTPSTSTATAGANRTGRSSTTRPSARPTPSGSNSPRTTRAAGSTTATSSSTSTRE